MGTNVTLKNGEIKPILDIEDIFDLVEQELGLDVRVQLDEYVGEYIDKLGDYQMAEIDLISEKRDFKNDILKVTETAKSLDELKGMIKVLCDNY